MRQLVVSVTYLLQTVSQKVTSLSMWNNPIIIMIPLLSSGDDSGLLVSVRLAAVRCTQCTLRSPGLSMAAWRRTVAPWPWTWPLTYIILFALG